ncbi:hypothetical protein [Falsibacillus albus]|uniref:PepSY domain-containing protein n=1 Tax=Falsibacillus albus TaxID=2478915 RepID=A0A3L7K4B4_9BACI|nr:hypothetical protein [Falsibacillus albus]RLQ97893.1 hypothetical protein D9X91_00415 [Falsibacillus albus]
MNWKSFIIGTATGAAAGYIMSGTVQKRTPVSAESVLSKVKKAFKEDGAIDGSWIQMKPETFEKHALKTQIYRGGISRHRNGKLQQFEFIADVHSGTILDINLLTPM